MIRPEPLYKAVERMFQVTQVECVKCGQQMELKVFVEKKACPRCEFLELIEGGENEDHRLSHTSGAEEDQSPVLVRRARKSI